MAIEMVAAKRFRLAQESGFVWIEKGQTYTVENEKQAQFHERGRGKRVEQKQLVKNGKKGD